MNEELKNNEELTEEAVETTEEAAQEAAETMDDYADQIDVDPVWKNFEELLEKQTVITVEVGGIVKAGVVAYVDGVRGFIPASQLDIGYVENLESWLGRQVDVVVITADAKEKRLVLSGKKVARAKAEEAKKEKIAAMKIGTVVKGVVESLKPYGAFVDIGDGMTGLVHVSQISRKRVKTPEDVLKVGDEVEAKVIAVKDGKISLSMKALAEEPEEPAEEVFPYREDGKASTSLGALLKDIKLD